MGIFDIFRKPSKINKYQVFYESISDVLKLLHRKRHLVVNLKSGSVIVDLEFDKQMNEQIKLVSLIKSGSISFLGREFNNDILDLFNNQEIKKDEIENIWNYLMQEQSKLKKLF